MTVIRLENKAYYRKSRKIKVPIISIQVESTREANSDSILHCIRTADAPMGLCSGWKWAYHKQNCKTLGTELAKCSSTGYIKILGLVICCSHCTIIFFTVLNGKNSC